MMDERGDRETLPDLLAPGLRLISIGLNPSLPSVKAGFYFANPRNRFWSALNQSGLVDPPLQPGAASMQVLFERYGIGFTDLVKRPTRGASVLRAADYRTGAGRLHSLIERYRPAVAWFHGKLAYRNFAHYTGQVPADCAWGWQPVRIGDSAIFVSPNPSPANAAYSLHALVGWYRQLRCCMAIENQ